MPRRHPSNLIRVMPAKGRTLSWHTPSVIAGLIGPLLAAIGVAMLINRSLFPTMIAYGPDT